MAPKTAVEGICPECGSAGLRRYPVIAELGWETVIKCQVCLFSVERTPAPAPAGNPLLKGLRDGGH